MRKYLRKYLSMAAGSLALGGAIGCQTMGQPHSEAGYSFSYTKLPAVVTGPNISTVTSSSGSGLVSLDHQSGMTAMPAPVEASSQVEGRYRSAIRSRSTPAFGPNPSPSSSDCTMQDVCDKLDLIARQLNGRAAPPAPEQAPKRMPPGEPKE